MHKQILNTENVDIFICIALVPPVVQYPYASHMHTHCIHQQQRQSSSAKYLNVNFNLWTIVWTFYI